MIQDFYVPMTRKNYTGQTKTDEYDFTKNYTDETINGYIGSRSNFNLMVAGKWTVKSVYKFYADINCKSGDLIVFDGNTYKVVSDPQNTINKNHHYKAYLEQMQNIT